MNQEMKGWMVNEWMNKYVFENRNKLILKGTKTWKDKWWMNEWINIYLKIEIT